MSRELNAISPREGEGPPSDRAAIGVLFRLLRPLSEPAFRWRLILTIGLLGGTAALNSAVPLLFADAVDAFAATAPIAPAAIGAGSILAVYVGLHWLSRLMNEARWALYGPIDQHLQRRLARLSIAHMHTLSLGFHLSRRTGHVSRVMDNGLRGLREIVFDSVFVIVPLAGEILFVAIVLLVRVDWVFALVLCLTLALYGTVLVIGSERLRVHQRRAVTRGSEAHGEAVDSLLNYETVKLFGNEGYIVERYDESLAEVERLVVRSMSYRSLLGIVMASIVSAGMGITLFLAARRVSAGHMTVGELVLVNAYLLQLARPMERLGNLYRAIKQALVDLEELLALLTTRPDIVDRPGAGTLPAGPGAVSFRDVSFGYGAERGILAHVSFDLAPGSKTAIVGPTGGGKSTVVRLLLRFYEPDSGAVLVDGADISSVTQASLREAIAVVPQDPVLFNATIGLNIAFGRPEAREAEVVAAARAARLDAFVSSLPAGYDTLVGERGLKLSGGEKQRVAIARAVLKGPRILVLDEATSALDSATEEQVQSNLREISAGVTTLVIAHRLSTVVDADEILVLDGGRVVERGTHAALLARSGLYAELWQRQASEAAEAGRGDGREAETAEA